MKIGETIKKGTILVATATQSTYCGVKYIKEGSILKVAKTKSEYSDYVKVFRNKKAEEENYYHNIDISKVREAKEIEIQMWDKEIYFVESVKTF